MATRHKTSDQALHDDEKNRRPYWEPIGQFVMEFGFLERDIDDVIWQALFLHKMQGEALTSQVKNLSARINLAQQFLLILHIEASQPQQIKQVMKEIGELNSFRNNLVHGPWGLYDLKLHFWEKTKVDGHNFKPKTFQIRRQDIMDNIKRLQNTRKLLAKLTQSIITSFLQEMEDVPWHPRLARRKKR